MYIQRHINTEITAMANCYPVVTLLGPRQSGKTTAVRHLFADYPYINLEEPDVLEAIKADPRKFLRLHKSGVIIDEIQRLPELLSYIQAVVDSNQQTGQFILTGSHQLALAEAITQSLAGRTAVLHLLPFSMAELAAQKFIFDVDQYLISGFYPRIFTNNIIPTKYYRDYVSTYVERDLRQLINIKDMSLFRKCLKLCAGRVGQILNAHNLSQEVGVSSHTIKAWLSILEALYIIILLPPYFKNFSKRAIKSPKLYFVDVGLACYLLGITEPEQIARDPLRGSLFENMVIMEFYKKQYNAGTNAELYFFRDNNQNEVDLILPKGRQLIPIEIKSAETFHPNFLHGLAFFNRINQSEQPTGYLIYAGDRTIEIKDYNVINYKDILKI